MPSRSTDVVVVGAGSAGVVVAARLSDRSMDVLLLEEGPAVPIPRPGPLDDAGSVPSATGDAGWIRWFDVKLAPGRVARVPYGRVVGGSSAVNGCSFVRGTVADFDSWAALGNDQWSYDRVLPAFRRLERDLDHGDDPWHGTDGPIPVRRATPAELSPVTAAFLGAAEELGFPEEVDKNAPGRPGHGLLPRNEVDGRRVDVATAYLRPRRDRPNLRVEPRRKVLRVLVERGRAVGVETLDTVTGRRGSVAADLVVLSAGAIASCQLLMLSGIGPAEELTRLGLHVDVDAPGVGRLWDHPAVDVGYRSVGAALGTGALAQSALHVLGTDGREIEVLATTRPYGRASGDDLDDATLSLRVGWHPTGPTGRVSLVSADPLAPPRVHADHMANAGDRAAARHGVRLAVELLRSPELAAVVAGASGPTGADLGEDARLDRWILEHLGTSMHAAGTCAMGPDSDPSAVVDQRGRVRGVDGLVVADTSVMPRLTSRGPAATAVMIGERLAELL